jgi:hypothetical protein
MCRYHPLASRTSDHVVEETLDPEHPEDLVHSLNPPYPTRSCPQSHPSLIPRCPFRYYPLESRTLNHVVEETPDPDHPEDLVATAEVETSASAGAQV